MASDSVASSSGRAGVSPLRTNVVSVFLFLAVAGLGVGDALYDQTELGKGLGLGLGSVLGLIVAQSPKVAKQWERGIVLRLDATRSCRARGCSG